MNSSIPSPVELVGTLTELRARHWVSNADYNVFRQRLLANDAKEVNLELYRRDLISSRQFNTHEVAIERDRRLEAAVKNSEPVVRPNAKKSATRHLERTVA